MCSIECIVDTKAAIVAVRLEVERRFAQRAVDGDRTDANFSAHRGSVSELCEGARLIDAAVVDRGEAGHVHRVAAIGQRLLLVAEAVALAGVGAVFLLDPAGDRHRLVSPCLLDACTTARRSTPPRVAAAL